MTWYVWRGRFSGDAVEEISRLRRLAWNTVMPVEGAAGLDDVHDEHAFHWMVRCHGTLVAAARLCIHAEVDACPDADVLIGAFHERPSGPVASISRLVIHPAYRGRGLATRLDVERLRAAEHLRARSVVGWTWGRRIAALERLGFETVATARSRTPFWERLAMSVESVVLHLDLKSPGRASGKDADARNL